MCCTWRSSSCASHRSTAPAHQHNMDMDMDMDMGMGMGMGMDMGMARSVRLHGLKLCISAVGAALPHLPKPEAVPQRLLAAVAARAAVLDQLEHDHPEVDAASDEEHPRVAQTRVGGRQIVEEFGHHLEAILDAHPHRQEGELRTQRGTANTPQ